jgi:hypothetical protein
MRENRLSGLMQGRELLGGLSAVQLLPTLPGKSCLCLSELRGRQPRDARDYFARVRGFDFKPGLSSQGFIAAFEAPPDRFDVEPAVELKRLVGDRVFADRDRETAEGVMVEILTGYHRARAR